MSTISEADLERMHQVEWNWSRTQRFVLAKRALDPRWVLARRFERMVHERLTESGLVVSGTGHMERFDLLAQGVRIEVKAAMWDGCRYQCNLHGNRADVLVWGCLDGIEGRGNASPLQWFVIPFEQVRGLSVLKITSRDPRDYVGRWTPFYGRWETIDELVAAGRNIWQPGLMETIC